jgi:hypothetical protein
MPRESGASSNTELRRRKPKSSEVARLLAFEDREIRGNGHMVMIEKNSPESAKLLDDWMQMNVK